MRTFRGVDKRWRTAEGAFGRGSFGAVAYAAPAIQAAGRHRYVIKWARTTQGSDDAPCTDAQLRFIRVMLKLEIDTLSKLQHPHIVPLIDRSRPDDAIFYIMPRYKCSLHKLSCEYGSLPGLVRPALVQLYSALAYLHELNLAHCDVSSANVLVRNTDYRRIIYVVLCDFGSAQRGLVDDSCASIKLAKKWASARDISCACRTAPQSAAPECWEADDRMNPNVWCDVWAAAASALAVTGIFIDVGQLASDDAARPECDRIKRARPWWSSTHAMHVPVFRLLRQYLPGRGGGALALLLADRVFVGWRQRTPAGHIRLLLECLDEQN